jgi:hypothetical protein
MLILGRERRQQSSSTGTPDGGDHGARRPARQGPSRHYGGRTCRSTAPVAARGSAACPTAGGLSTQRCPRPKVITLMMPCSGQTCSPVTAAEQTEGPGPDVGGSTRRC